MKVIGITGGVGAGKTTILNILKQDFNAYIIIADEVGHRLMQPGGPTYQCIVTEYGSGILDADGQINRKKLAKEVFSSEEQLKKLNRLTHPIIREEIQKEIKRVQEENSYPIVVLEAAILKEGGLDIFCDEIWYVFVEESIRIRRLMDSRGYSIEKAKDIINKQMTEKEYRSFSHFVIDNSNDIENSRMQIQKRLNGICLDSCHHANYNRTDTFE